MINIDDVIKDLALKNGQAVEKGDPIMALITIMTKIAEGWQVAMDKSLQQHLSEHEIMAARWRKNTPAQVNKVLDAATAAGKETMAKAMSEGAEKVMAIVREREQHLLHEIMEGALRKQKTEMAVAAETMAKTFKRHYLRMLAWMLAGNVAVMLLGLFVASWF